MDIIFFFGYKKTHCRFSSMSVHFRASDSEKQSFSKPTMSPLIIAVLSTLAISAKAGLIPAAAPLVAAGPAPLAYASPFAAQYYSAPLIQRAAYAAPVARAFAQPIVAAPAPVVAARSLAAPVVAAPAPVVAAPAPLVAAEEVDSFPQYRFAYDVQDTLTGDSKTQEESRDGDVVRGSYSLIEPDGSRRIVSYYADDISGFNAVVQKDVPVAAVAPVVAAKTIVAPAPVVAAKTIVA
ncbi:cuticle protein 18.6 [Episyrphus balteatus]|uniref:cuticle protein 18.6 n=1 Tax=Episyrphus balteatus TaxID=286459 RepID=UPI0024861C8B|nr:cuticle protein 18.6 [Episyrphus balteatus]